MRMPELKHPRVLRAVAARLRARHVTLAGDNLLGLLQHAAERHAAAA